MSSPVRVAVIGTGSIGRNHVRIYQDLPQAQLVAVADQSIETVELVAKQYGIHGYTDYREMLKRERPQAVTVAVPTSEHYSVTLDVLEAGCHVLVEKPITLNPDEALRLVEAFERVDLVLAVGHIERFNPAVIELKRRLQQGEAGRIFQIHTRRLGPFPTRVLDVGVTIDLAVHDLDVIRYLIGRRPERLFAETRQKIHASHEDMFVGMIAFEEDILGLLEINWLTPAKIREIHVTAERGMFVVNYLTQDLTFFENAMIHDSDWNSLAVLQGVNEGVIIRYPIKKKEPLRVEQEAFLAAVNGDRSKIVSGHDGLIVLQLAHQLVMSGQQHKVCLI